jgi:stage III sporulation protein AF
MSQLLSSWAVSVTVAILFSAMISTLLPETNIKKYIKVVLGIVVTVIILSPLFSLGRDIDIRSEVDSIINEVNDLSHDDKAKSRYTDYILDVYEVYIGDE